MNATQATHLSTTAIFPLQINERQKMVTGLLNHRPDRYLPTREELNQLLAGHMTTELWSLVFAERHVWIGDFLQSLNWWIKLSHAALEIRNTDGDDRPNPDFFDRRVTFSHLLEHVMAAFVPAMRDTSTYAEDWDDREAATVDLLKRYRLYTKAVETFVLEVWPEVGRELLLNPDFGWKN